MVKRRPRIVCVLPCLPHVDPVSLPSIMKQTLPPEIIIITLKKLQKYRLPEGLCEVINPALKMIDLRGFDYILNVGSDVILPPNFVEDNIKDSPDLVGDGGCAMLTKVSPFMKYLNGQYHPLGEDSYTAYKFMQHGLKVQHLKVNYTDFSSNNPHSTSYFLILGGLMYRLGYEPIHVAYRILFSPMYSFTFFSYLYYLATNKDTSDVAQFVRYKQVQRLKDIGRNFAKIYAAVKKRTQKLGSGK